MKYPGHSGHALSYILISGPWLAYFTCSLHALSALVSEALFRQIRAKTQKYFFLLSVGTLVCRHWLLHNSELITAGFPSWFPSLKEISYLLIAWLRGSDTRGNFSVVLCKMHTLLFCHCSVKLPCWLREHGLCVCAGTCLLSRSNRIFPPDVWLVMTPVRRWWSPILSSVSTAKLFSHLAPEATELTAEITVYLTHSFSSNIVMKRCIPSLSICMLLWFIILRFCTGNTAQQQNHD